MNNITLTIAVLSVPSRTRTFLPYIVDKLNAQAQNRPVELLLLLDNKTRTIGRKRNDLIRLAQGQYIVFVDDDDDVTDDFVDEILEAAKSGTDVIVFDIWVTLDGQSGKNCRYGLDLSYENLESVYHRKPNGRMVCRTELAKMIAYPDISLGEDDRWGEAFSCIAKTQHRIEKNLSFYKFDSVLTEAQKRPVAPEAR